jgi:hypothetical protein
VSISSCDETLFAARAYRRRALTKSTARPVPSARRYVSVAATEPVPERVTHHRHGGPVWGAQTRCPCKAADFRPDEVTVVQVG